MTIKQLSVFLENKPGQLAGIMRTLAAAGVNIVTLSLANAPEFGIVRMIADDHVKGADALAKAGFAVRETEVVAVTVPDRPGGMAELTAKLDKAGVDIEYSYAYSLGHAEKAVLVFKFDDNAKAEAALASV
ncbi:MAG: amino acid-binding protein [Clostridia bacterium]|nr:amino acid-binding protein [Clostridia bacterium]